MKKGDCLLILHSTKKLAELIKEITGRHWSQTKKQWHFNLNKQVLELIKQKLANKGVVDSSLLKMPFLYLLAGRQCIVLKKIDILKNNLKLKFYKQFINQNKNEYYI